MSYRPGHSSYLIRDPGSTNKKEGHHRDDERDEEEDSVSEPSDGIIH